MITVDSYSNFVAGEIRYTVTVRTTTWTVLTQLYDRFHKNYVNHVHAHLTIEIEQRLNRPSDANDAWLTSLRNGMTHPDYSRG